MQSDVDFHKEKQMQGKFWFNSTYFAAIDFYLRHKNIAWRNTDNETIKVLEKL